MRRPPADLTSRFFPYASIWKPVHIGEKRIVENERKVGGYARVLICGAFVCFRHSSNLVSAVKKKLQVH